MSHIEALINSTSFFQHKALTARMETGLGVKATLFSSAEEKYRFKPAQGTKQFFLPLETFSKDSAQTYQAHLSYIGTLLAQLVVGAK